MTPLGPAPYERLLAQRPGDREQFEANIQWLLLRSRPGPGYRAGPFASPARRRELRGRWEAQVRSVIGVSYELGRRR